MNQVACAGQWRYGIWSWGSLIVLAVMPLLYALPLVSVGLDDLHGVRYLDEGEFTILNAWREVYPRGPLYAGRFDPLHIYPKAFYNLAGILLYPYSYFRGEDFRMVLTVWRGMNALCGVGAALMLFFLVQRVFHSRPAAFLAAGLFVITPEFLTWTANVRPNPFEQLLIFATLFCCVLLCEQFSSRLFLLASLTGALAFASKYGGMPFLVLIPVVSVYVSWRRDSDQRLLTSVVHQQTRVLRITFPFFLIVVGTLVVVFAWLFYRHGWDGVSMFISLTRSAFPPELVAKVGGKLNQWRFFVNAVPWGLLVVLVAVEALLVVFWRWSKRGMSGRLIRSGITPYAFLLGIFAIQTAGIYTVTFFITGPAYIANPDHFVSQVGYMTYYSGLAGSWEQSPGFFEGLRRTAAEVPGWWLFVLLVAYAGFIQVRDRDISAVDYDRRIMLWLYILISMAVFLGTRVVVVRHILPALGLLYGFVGYAVVRKLQDWRTGLLSRATSAVLVALLIGYIGTNTTVAFERWEDKRAGAADIGFTVGKWLRTNYDPHMRILTDHWTFYTPPEFQHVSTTTYAEWQGKTALEKEQSVKHLILTFDPEIVIIADHKNRTRPVNLEWLLIEDPTLQVRDYRLIKSFTSQRRGDLYRSIEIYEKNGLHPRSG